MSDPDDLGLVDWYNVFWACLHGDAHQSREQVLEMDFVELRIATHARDMDKPLTPSGFDAHTPQQSRSWDGWYRKLTYRQKVQFYREVVR